MSRSTKKLLYGLFYFFVFVLILWPLLKISFERTASCFDGRQNQGERGVDCGGPCVPCEIKNLEPLRISPPEIFTLDSGETSIIVEIQNPNADYGAVNFLYTIEFFDSVGQSLGVVNGEDSIYGSERRYIFGASTKKVARAEVKVENLNWRPIAEIIRPTISLRGSPSTEISTNTIRVRGTIANLDSFGAKEVRVIAVLANEFGERLFASQRVLGEGLAAFSETSFTVIFPFDSKLAAKISPAMTEIFISSQ